MELDAHVLGALSLEETVGSVAFKADFAVGGVVADGYIVLLSELDDTAVEVYVGDCAGRVVRVVNPQDLGPIHDVGGDVFKFGEVAVFFHEGDRIALAAGEEGAHGVDGVGGVGDEGDVVGINQAEGDVGDALLRPDERDDLGVGVEVHVEPGLVPIGDALAKLGESVGLGVSVVCGDLALLV